MPVLPDVGSTIMVLAWILPAFSAASIMAAAMRSLTLLPGLKNSSLTATRAGKSLPNAFNCSNGVLPIKSVMLFAIAMMFFLCVKMLVMILRHLYGVIKEFVLLCFITCRYNVAFLFRLPEK